MTQTSGSSSEKTFSQAIKDRRATPGFLPDPVPENDLKKILEAGLSAPSAYNLQPWRFVAVREAEQRARLRQAAMNQPKVEEAPVVIVACADLEGWRAAISTKSSVLPSNTAMAMRLVTPACARISPISFLLPATPAD